jgi:NitT/TauT family transport system substrate-binding protein
MLSRRRAFVFAVVASLLSLPQAISAEVLVRVAVPQRGGWETGVPDIGQRAGIFAKHGIKLEVLYTSGGGETMQALISGSVDIAIATGTTAIMAAFAKGAPIRPIAASVTGPSDIYWYVAASSPIKSLKDAAGKTMAFSAIGSSSNLATLKLISQSGVAIKAVPTGTPLPTYTQVMSGQIDIGWGTPPYGLNEIKDGKIRVIAKYTDIPEYRDMTARMHASNLNFITDKPDVLKRFLDGYRDTIDFMYDGDAAFKVFADVYEAKPEQAKATRDGFYPDRKMLDLKRLGGIDQAMKDAQELKFISKPLTKAELDEMFKYYLK